MKVRVEVNKPVDAVWKHFNDSAKTKGWVSWLVEVKDLTPGNDGVGSKEIWVMEDKNNNNQKMEITNEVTAIDPQKRLDLNLTAPGAFAGTSTYLFEDLGGGRTAVTNVARYRFDNAFARFMTPVVLSVARDKMAGDMDHFKANVEKE